MNMNLRLLQLIESILGKSKKTAGSNHAFFCPICKHHKPKLEINIETGRFNCWVCGTKGSAIYFLFKKLNVHHEKIATLNELIGNTKTFTNKKDKTHLFELPKDYKPLWEPSNHPEYKNALRYLIDKRKLTKEDILRYQIGYCDAGEYARKIIIPSYDSECNLNFFTGRCYYNEDFKHKNPSWSKNIIGFESWINWQLPVVLCEGAFDAITIRRNAIPLFGKLVLDNLKIKIFESKVKDLYIVLDKDAQVQAIKMAKYFMENNITVHFVNLPDKDPNEMGFEKITKLIKQTEPLTFSSLMKHKLELV